MESLKREIKLAEERLVEPQSVTAVSEAIDALGRAENALRRAKADGYRIRASLRAEDPENSLKDADEAVQLESNNAEGHLRRG